MNVTERFLHYVSFETTSDEDGTASPTTAGQRVFGEFLVKELATIGMTGARIDENGYVYAFLPASAGHEADPAIGLIAHMDTSPDVSGKNVCASIVRYTGEDLTLANGEVLSAARFPSLDDYVGKDLIVTDGTTLLGADDKAGIAEIVSACAHLLSNPEIPHRAVAVCFTPDEEIGSGADLLDLGAFPAKEAYTVDGGEIGEIEYENFNAASARVTIHGVNIHPGSAKNRMKNAVLLASEFISMLPPAETPAHTEGYEGFYHVSDIRGNESEAELKMLIRDHDRASFERRRAFLMNLCEYLNGVHGAGTFDLTVTDSYYNMKEKILPHMHLIENAASAMRACGVTPKIVPIRGGTDGARLSFRGLPCPNLSTGGVNFHSIHEFIPVFALETMTRVLITIAEGEFAK